MTGKDPLDLDDKAREQSGGRNSDYLLKGGTTAEMNSKQIN